MDILVIAPDEPVAPVGMAKLSGDYEIERVTGRHRCVVMTGPVDYQRIIDLVSERTSEDWHFDILYIIAHASEQGVQLFDSVMTPDQMLRLAKRGRFRLVFLNACKTSQTGQFLVDNGVPAALTYSSDVPDAEALAIATAFFSELYSNDGDMKAAYQVAKPSNGMMSWFSNGHYLDAAFEPLILRIESLERKIGEIEKSFGSIAKSLENRNLALMMVSLGLGAFGAWIASNLHLVEAILR